MDHFSKLWRIRPGLSPDFSDAHIFYIYCLDPVDTYIYTYPKREKEKERERKKDLKNDGESRERP